MPYEPLHHKYRPQRFADLVGQDAIATTLASAIRTERIAPAYLFTGPRGTGKTSSARILAKSLNCLQSDRPTEQPCGVCEVCRAIARGSALDVIEIDAASNTGVDNIRELIERAQFAPVQCRYKVYCIDECHMLSIAAFNALLKTLEEPPDRVVFVLATTDPQRVLPTIISRCQRFDFRRIPLEAMVIHLRAIATQENINITQDGIQLLAQIAQGGLRDAESLLDQLSLLPSQITVEQVWNLVGMVPEHDLMALLAAITDNNPETVLDQARNLMDQGHEPLTVLQNLAGFYRDLLIAKTAPTRPDLVTLTPPTWTKLCNFAQGWDISAILAGQQHLRSCEAQVKSTTQPRLWLEVTLLGLLPLGSRQSVEADGLRSGPNGNVTRTDFEPGHAAVSKMPMASGQAPLTATLREQRSDRPQPPAQLEQSAATTMPGSKPTHSAPSTSASPDGASEKQEVQPAQVAAFDRTSGSEALPSSDTSITIEAPEPSNHPLSQASIPVHRASNPETLDTAAPTVSSKGRLDQASGPGFSTDVPPNLDQIWQQVVAHLHPPGTQALLHQQGCLLAFNGQFAHIGIRSQPLFKMAQARLPNIEAAFQKAFNCQVKINLEVVTSTESKSALPQEQTPRSTPLGPGQGIETTAHNSALVPQPSTSQLQPHPGINSPVASPTAETQLTAPQSTQSRQPKSGPVSPPQGTAEAFSEALPATHPAWEADEEAMRAAKSLAQFFNGEIVSQKNELVPGSTTPSDSLYPSGQPLTGATEDGSEPDEDEIPF